MIAAFFVCGILALMFVLLAWLFLTGNGDMLIAGYNTATEEERKQVDIVRLRRLMAVLSALTAVYCALLPVIGNDRVAVLSATGIFCLILFIFIILANTWAKKK